MKDVFKEAKDAIGLFMAAIIARIGWEVGAWLWGLLR